MVAIGATSVALGCPTLDAYHCVEDGDCNRGGEVGRCLVDAACAYPEANGRCESGWARSPNASTNPNACVDEEPIAGTGSSSTSPSTASSTSTSSSNSTDTTGSSTSGSPETTTGPQQCGWSTQLSIDTFVFSPGVAQQNFTLWVPLEDTSLEAPLIDEGLSLRLSTPQGDVLAHERNDAFDGTPALWLRLPDFEADAQLTVNVQALPDLEPPDPAEVWSSTWVGVWHFEDVPNGFEDTPVRNAVQAAEVGFMRGAMEAEQHVPALLGAGLAFDGIDDLVSIEAQFVGTLDDYTISMWTRYDSADPNSRGSYFQRLNGDFFYPRCWRNDGDFNAIICQQEVGEGINSTSTNPVPIGEWLHLTMVRDAASSTTTIYVDGEAVSTLEDAAGVLATDDPPRPFELGNGEWGGLLGALDEVRVSARPLPATRIGAEVRSQLAPGASITVGPLEPLPCP